MIIKGVDNMMAHLLYEHDKNIEEWYKHNGKTRRAGSRSISNDTYFHDYGDEIAGGRGLEHLFFDIPN